MSLKFILPLVLLFAGAADFRACADPAAVDIAVRRMSDGLRFGLIGAGAPRPAPVLILPDTIENTRRTPAATATARLLADSGFIIVIIDPPAHGEDRQPGEGPTMEDGLLAMRRRLEAGDDLFTSFNRRAERVIDYLIGQGEADPRRMAAFGLSRGGFLAFHLAASDPRIKVVGALSPLIDVMSLQEFRDFRRPDLAASVALPRIAPQLADKAIWVGISNDDERVGADRAIAFTRAVVRAAVGGRPGNPVVPVALIVGPAIHAGGRGHYGVEDGAALAATWILKQFGMLPAVQPSPPVKATPDS